MKLCLFFSVIFNPFYIGPYEGYFCVCLGCHNLHLHYKRLSNLPFLVSRKYKNTLFYFKYEIKDKQPFENMWSKYIKENFYLYIACFWIKNSNFGRFVFQINFFSLRQDILIFDGVHSSACNIGHFLGQAFTGIFFCFLKCIEKKLQFWN